MNIRERYCFRGKKHNDKTFAYGSLLLWEDGSASIDTGNVAEPMYSIDPSTIGQSTNVKDKNKKIIFDGDLLKYINSIGTEIIGVVNWSIGCFTCRVVSPNHLIGNNPALDIVLYESNDTVEVIGNIYDNPELL